MTVIEKTKTTQIDEELKKSYLDYAMSVIISRALPDIRDGLKPVQRRIIYSAWDNGYKSDKSFVKSARIVGNVMGGLHPHGDSSIYDAMVRMAQPWNMMAPLIDGQGNFGSIDADPQAAARYTEARLTKIAETLLLDLHKDTVSWSPNYDETMKEPDVLPAAFPNLLINGTSGVAVGMATNIPPHNLGEVIDGTIAYIDKPKISIQDILSIIKGPDFPTGGVVINSQDFLEIYNSGRGPITIRGKAQVEPLPFSKKKGIVITEIPYQVVKANLVKQLAELTVKPDPKDVNNKKKSKYIDGISDVRDESDREGIRIVVELKSGVNGQDILELLYKVTQLEEKFGYNMLAITKGRPETLSLLDIIKEFIEFRKDVVTKRLTFDLNAFKKQANILIGLVVAVLNIDTVLEIIKGSPNPAAAKEKLISTRWKAKSIEPYLSIIGHTLEKGEYLLNEDQAKAILDLRLHRLTGLERDKIEKELADIAKEVQKILEILGSEKKLMSLIKSELNDLKKQFATTRKTEIL